MSRRSLYQLETMYSRTLEVWDRLKAKKIASKISFRPSCLLPPEDLPIQGLMMLEPPKKHEKERDGQKRSLRRNFADARRMKRKRRRLDGDRRREEALKMDSRAVSFLCRCCDYRDKITGRCLIIRLGGECPYMNGVYSYMPKKPMKVSARGH